MHVGAGIREKLLKEKKWMVNAHLVDKVLRGYSYIGTGLNFKISGWYEDKISNQGFDAILVSSFVICPHPRYSVKNPGNAGDTIGRSALSNNIGIYRCEGKYNFQRPLSHRANLSKRIQQSGIHLISRRK